MTLTVAAFSQGIDVPSARFRVRQLVAPMREHDIRLQEWPAEFGSYPPEGLRARLSWLPRSVAERLRAIREASEAQLGFFQRAMISTLMTVERFWRKPALLDVDDAIWLHQRWRSVDRLARWAGGVICGNAFIAEHFNHHTRTWLLPTGVDVSRFCPSESRRSSDVIVWSGSASGLGYLRTVEPALQKVFDSRANVRLRVVSSKRPYLNLLPRDRVEFVQWSPEVEVPALQSACVGIMPMPDNPWTRGKCSFKMLTYMACGLPVVVSPVGMNAELLTQGNIGHGARSTDQWVDSLIDLLDNPSTAESAGVAGRSIAVRDFSVERIAERLATILHGYIGTPKAATYTAPR